MSTKKDETGRDRVFRNLTARWLGEIVVIVSGFVIPRQIDTFLGAESLGVWDFGWSTVAYFRLLGFGFAAGLNRFVALHSAEGDVVRLQRAVSSTILLQLIFGAMTAGVSIILAQNLDWIVKFDDLSLLSDSKIVVMTLGLAIAVRMVFWPSRGILTGYHLTTITAGVTAVGDIVVLAGLVIVLVYGGGLPELGGVVLSATLLTEITRAAFAKRVYRLPAFEFGAVHLGTMRKMFRYGIKNSVSGLPTVIVIQGTSILVANALGPAALAMLARPLALCNVISQMVRQYSFLLTPIAGSLQGLGRDSDLREFFLSSLRNSVALTVPPFLLLAIYGDIVISIWMGPDYVVWPILPILSILFILPIASSAAMRILAGRDAHGAVAIRSLLVAVSAFILLHVAAGFRGISLESAALVIGVSLTLGPGLSVMFGASKKLSVGLVAILQRAFATPILCNLPLVAIALGSRFYWPDLKFFGAVSCSIVAGLVVLSCYWRYMLTASERREIRGKASIFEN